MLRGMVTLLLENGQIVTTVTRAKEVRSITEKMVTLGKENTLASRRAALSYITKEAVVVKLFTEYAPCMPTARAATPNVQAGSAPRRRRRDCPALHGGLQEAH